MRTKCDAAALVSELDRLKAVILAILWVYDDKWSITKSDMDLATALGLLWLLHLYVGTLQDQFAELKESAFSVIIYGLGLCLSKPINACTVVCGLWEGLSWCAWKSCWAELHLSDKPGQFLGRQTYSDNNHSTEWDFTCSGAQEP